MADMGTKQQGLTLVELMITLAVAIILVTVGMPMFTGMAANNRAAAQTNALVSAMKLARSEAVKRATTVNVCAAATTLPVASPTCDAGSPASTRGWIVHADVNNNGFDAGDVIRAWDGLANSAGINTTGANVVQFGSTGESNGGFTFELVENDATGTGTRCVTVTAVGQVHSKRGTCP